MSKEKEDTNKMGTPISIEWYVPDGLMTPSASNMVVQIIEDVFKVSFFEVKLPILTDETEPPPSKVRADCVASVFIAPSKLPTFIKVLQKQLDKYLLKNQAE